MNESDVEKNIRKFTNILNIYNSKKDNFDLITGGRHQDPHEFFSKLENYLLFQKTKTRKIKLIKNIRESFCLKKNIKEDFFYRGKEEISGMDFSVSIHENDGLDLKELIEKRYNSMGVLQGYKLALKDFCYHSGIKKYGEKKPRKEIFEKYKNSNKSIEDLLEVVQNFTDVIFENNVPRLKNLIEAKKISIKNNDLCLNPTKVLCQDEQTVAVSAEYVPIFLKRVDFDISLGTPSRNEDFILPNERIEMKAQDGKYYSYKLSGAILHKGKSSYYGHYISCSLRGDSWYIFDDLSNDRCKKIGEGKFDDFIKIIQFYGTKEKNKGILHSLLYKKTDDKPRTGIEQKIENLLKDSDDFPTPDLKQTIKGVIDKWGK